MHMKDFLNFVKKFLNDKYPHIDFDLYHSNKKRKDSLEKRAKPAVFSL